MPFIVDAPTLEGEIKKARAANYTWLRVIAEFIDNSFDAIIKKSKSGNVRLTFGLDTNDTLKSISISDNCEVGFYDPNAWSWTYKRERTEEDCGEFGTGFKSGSVNISSKLICYTNINGNYKKMIADWEDMSRENSFTPEFSEITEDKYNSFHPYGHGTTFLMKDLIYTTIPCDYNHIREKVIYFLKTTYKKKLRDNKHLSIEVCSSNDTQEKITVIDYTTKEDFTADFRKVGYIIPNKELASLLPAISTKTKYKWKKTKIELKFTKDEHENILEGPKEVKGGDIPVLKRLRLGQEPEYYYTTAEHVTDWTDSENERVVTRYQPNTQAKDDSGKRLWYKVAVGTTVKPGTIIPGGMWFTYVNVKKGTGENHLKHLMSTEVTKILKHTRKGKSLHTPQTIWVPYATEFDGWTEDHRKILNEL